jgi:Flp pilus assembly pilin Flp
MGAGAGQMMLHGTVWLQLAVERRAVTALEYGLIAGIVVAIIMVGFRFMANSLSSKFVAVGTSL